MEVCQDFVTIYSNLLNGISKDHCMSNREEGSVKTLLRTNLAADRGAGD